MSVKVPLLIIGAGTYGLGLGVCAQHHRLDYLVVGNVMDCWQHNIPEGQSFLEVTNWHFDPIAGHTIEDYISKARCRDYSSPPTRRRAILENFLLTPWRC